MVYVVVAVADSRLAVVVVGGEEDGLYDAGSGVSGRLVEEFR